MSCSVNWWLSFDGIPSQTSRGLAHAHCGFCDSRLWKHVVEQRWWQAESFCRFKLLPPLFWGFWTARKTTESCCTSSLKLVGHAYKKRTINLCVLLFYFFFFRFLLLPQNWGLPSCRCYTSDIAAEYCGHIFKLNFFKAKLNLRKTSLCWVAF